MLGRPCDRRLFFIGSRRKAFASMNGSLIQSLCAIFQRDVQRDDSDSSTIALLTQKTRSSTPLLAIEQASPWPKVSKRRSTKVVASSVCECRRASRPHVARPITVVVPSVTTPSRLLSRPSLEYSCQSPDELFRRIVFDNIWR